MSHCNTRLENRVRVLRKLRGLTQQDLGSLLGVSRQTINAIENGRYDPSLSLAFDIARVFATRIESVFRPVQHGVEVESWGTLMLKIPVSIHAGPVCLRPHKPSDLPAFQRFVTDPDSTKYMAFTTEQKTEAGAAALMDWVIGSYASDTPIFSLSIVDPETDLYVGAAGGAEAGDGVVELFVTLLPEARGKGYATAAVRALLRYLFLECGAKEVRADVVKENTSSVKLFERLGFRYLGSVERAAVQGELAHRPMQGVRYALTRGQATALSLLDSAIAPSVEFEQLAAATQGIYNRNAVRFAAERRKHLHERSWLNRFSHLLPEGGAILDLGCGTGEPIAAYFAQEGYKVTGVDFSNPMLDIARARYSLGDWRFVDMRTLDLPEKFDGIIGWNSFFHLTPQEQRSTLPLLAAHLKPGGALMLTVGPHAGEVTGHVGDDQVYHSSLSPEEYETILADLDLKIVHFVKEDPDCNEQTVLIAQRQK